MADAAFVTCRHCPWVGEATTYPEAMALLDAHECVRVIQGIEHNETGYAHHGCRCPVCRRVHAECEARRKRGDRMGHRWGERHNWSKLTEADVIEIRRRLGGTVTHGEIAAEFGVHPTNVGKIARGETWKRLSSPSGA